VRPARISDSAGTVISGTGIGGDRTEGVLRSGSEMYLVAASIWSTPVTWDMGLRGLK